MKKKLLIIATILLAGFTIKVDALTNYLYRDNNYSFVLCKSERHCNTYTQEQIIQRGGTIGQSSVTLEGVTYYYDNTKQQEYLDDLKNKQQEEAQKEAKRAQRAATTNTITAEESAYCNKLADPLQFIGQIVKIFKIIIPIILIIMGIVDFGKAMVTEEKEVKGAIRKLIFRAISGVVIFLIPTIVYLLFNLVAGWTQMSGYTRACAKCVLNVDQCVKSSSGNSSSTTTTNTSSTTTTPNTGEKNVVTAKEPSNN